MKGLGEDASEVEVRKGDAGNYGTEQRNALSQCVGRSRRWHRRQGTLQLLGDISRGSPSSGEGVLIKELIEVTSHQP